MDGAPTEIGVSQENIHIEKLFGQCFEASNFKDNARIPVGGSMLSNEMSKFVVGDCNNFTNFYSEVDDQLAKYNLGQLDEWLIKQNIPIEVNSFSTLNAFTTIFGKNYPREAIAAAEGRLGTYQREENPKLSDLFANNTIACAEIASLAQFYLQKKGVNSKYISGAVLWGGEKSWEFSEKHSFILIDQGDKHYIYDPTNPINAGDPATGSKFLLPRIYTVSTDFEKEIRANKQKFIQAISIYGSKGTVDYFGVNDERNVGKESFVPPLEPSVSLARDVF